MTDPRIKQKAREVVENILNFAEKLSGKPLNFRLLINIKTGEHNDGQDRMNGYVAAALQSAVAEEREECRRYVHEHESLNGYSDGHGGDFETCQFASCIDLRARGQKETAFGRPLAPAFGPEGRVTHIGEADEEGK